MVIDINFLVALMIILIGLLALFFQIWISSKYLGKLRISSLLIVLVIFMIILEDFLTFFVTSRNISIQTGKTIHQLLHLGKILLLLISAMYVKSALKKIDHNIIKKDKKK